MKISPAIILSSGALLEPLAAGLKQRLRELHAGEPWLDLVAALHVNAAGEIVHTALNEGGHLLAGKSFQGLPGDGDFQARFQAMLGDNLELLTHEVLAGLFHELRRTDLAMALNRQGHQLEKNLHLCILAASGDPDSSVAALVCLLALHRLYLSGLIQERPSARLFIFLPDLFPDHDTAANWARTYEFLRELQALYMNARWFGEEGAKLEADFHPFILGRGLSSGLAMPSAESWLSPLAEFISGLVRNLIPAGPANLDFLAGKPALLNAFGFFKFFYPQRELDPFLAGLAQYELGRLFLDDSRAISTTELEKDLAAWTGLANPDRPGLDRELEAAAGVAAHQGWGRPHFSAEHFGGPGNLEAAAARAADQLASEYQRVKIEDAGPRGKSLAAASFQVADQKIAELDALAHKYFVTRVRDQEGEKISLEHAPALLSLFLNLPRNEEAPAADRAATVTGPAPPYSLEAWERTYLIQREELLGTPEKNHELSALELKIQEMNGARENNLERLKQLAASGGALKAEREKKLAAAEGREAEKAKAEQAKTEPAKIVPASPGHFTVPAGGFSVGKMNAPASPESSSIVDSLWGKKKDSGSAVDNLWGEKKEAAPVGQPAKSPTASPASAAAVLLDPRQEWRQPSAKEAEIEGREKVILEYQERLEKELPELQAKRDKLSSEILMSRKLVLDESFQDRKMLDLETAKNQDLSAMKTAAGRVAAGIQPDLEKIDSLKQSYKVKRALNNFLTIIFLPILLLVVALIISWGQGDALILGPWFASSPASIIGVGLFIGEVVLLFKMSYGATRLQLESEKMERRVEAGRARLAESLNEMARAYSGLLDQRYALGLNYHALLVFSRLREYARSEREKLTEFKALLKTPGSAAPRLKVQESPWEISLAPSDFDAYIGREYGAALAAKVHELCSPANLWGWFQAWLRGGPAPPLETELARISEQTFLKLREDKTLGERLSERLKDERFREFLGNLLDNLGVSALVNEETSCDSKVRKANYLALQADEETMNLLMSTIRHSTGLELTPVETDDPHNLLILMHWHNWAPFQLAQMAKARECRAALTAPGTAGRFSVLGPEGAGILPDVFPVKELLAPEQLLYRELAVYGIIGGWVKADWEKSAFQAGPELGAKLSMPPLYSYADYLCFLGSAEGAAGREFLADRMKNLLYGPRAEPVLLERDRCRETIERLVREYDLRRAIVNVLEEDDYELLVRFPEKLI